MTDIRELLRRLQLGEPDRRIARDLSLSRNTVARYRQWATAHKVLPGALPEPAALAALAAVIVAVLLGAARSAPSDRTIMIGVAEAL